MALNSSQFSTDWLLVPEIEYFHYKKYSSQPKGSTQFWNTYNNHEELFLFVVNCQYEFGDTRIE